MKKKLALLLLVVAIGIMSVPSFAGTDTGPKPIANSAPTPTPVEIMKTTTK